VARTDTTPWSVEVQSIARPTITLPVESVRVTCRVVVSPTAKLTLPGVTVTAFTGTGVEVTVKRAVSAGQP
jgi:hypothetical protein